MPGYSENRVSLHLAWQAVTHTFRFDGRATRSEAVSFFLLSTFCNLFRLAWDGDGTLIQTASTIWMGAWSLPWIALLVRRLHDQGLSGWWALTGAGGLGTVVILYLLPEAVEGTTHLTVTIFNFPARRIALNPASIAAVATALIAWFVVIAFYLRGPTTGANRYDPDPRAGH